MFIPDDIRSAGVRKEDCKSTPLLFSKLIGLCYDSGDKNKNILEKFIPAYNGWISTSDNIPSRDEWMCAFGDKCAHIVGTAKGRLLINQQSSVLENSGLCFHRNFGVPYIPGSAVKGAARHYAWEQWKNCSSEAEKKEIAEKIADTFGFPTGDDGLNDFIKENKIREKDSYSSGSVAFLAATAQYSKKAQPKLVLEIATPHHTNYYNDKQEKKAFDNENPVPIFFPAIEKGATFDFYIVALKDSADLDFAKKMLEEMLRANGLGAKTAAGFGWFDDIKEVSLQDSATNAFYAKFSQMKNREIKEWVKSDGIPDAEIQGFRAVVEQLCKDKKSIRDDLKKMKEKRSSDSKLKEKLGDNLYAQL